DPDTINALARQVCPLSSVLGVSESSIQTHVRFDTTSDLMCGSFEKPGVPTKNVAGCAEFVAPRHFSAKQEDIDAFSNSRNSGGTRCGVSGASGADAVSLVDAGQSSSVAIHEVQHNSGGVNVGEGDGRKPHGFGIESVGQNGQRT